ncbi:chromate transporter [Sporomusa sp.]|uniref:chromate transporter n=1 Tax=Sporomusa sp. TaxID=2078658 RepID=UPI002CE604E0|nr:chromate transporter [Sporomusa sp.]HWR45625.1 chromate transporter [Sporomusa sp.]
MTFQLFQLFLKLSLLCFGGGYVMIPIMMEAIERNRWVSAQGMTDTIAIAAMSPGPVAVNAAVGLGYQINGFAGAAAAFLGILIPCILVVVLAAVYFLKCNSHPAAQGILYGLRAVIPGIILVAALKMAIENGIIFSAHGIAHGINIAISSWNFEIKSIMIMVLSVILLIKTKIPPIFLIIASGLCGLVLF